MLHWSHRCDTRFLRGRTSACELEVRPFGFEKTEWRQKSMSRKTYNRGTMSLALVASVALAAVGSFFPTTTKQPAKTALQKKETSVAQQRPLNSDFSLFKSVSWDFSHQKKEESARKETPRNTGRFSNEIVVSGSSLKNIIGTFTTPFESITSTQKKPATITKEQFFLTPLYSDGPLTGVNELGNARITHTNSGVRTSNFGGPTDVPPPWHLVPIP
mgnify:CR=1 FL=1